MRTAYTIRVPPTFSDHLRRTGEQDPARMDGHTGASSEITWDLTVDFTEALGICHGPGPRLIEKLVKSSFWRRTQNPGQGVGGVVALSSIIDCTAIFDTLHASGRLDHL